MSECSMTREVMPELQLEALPADERESVFRHIEQCEACGNEWAAYRRTWSLLGELPEVALPSSARERFISYIESAESPATNVVPMRRRPALRWIAQAAAVFLVAGVSFVAGQRSDTTAMTSGSSVVAGSTAPQFALSDRMILPASNVSSDIMGSPEVRNVRFIPAGQGGEIAVSFDMTSNVTITGRPDDQSLVRILAWFLQNQENPTHSRSSAIQWVRDTYEQKETAHPELVRALANVLQNDTHEGVRIKAVETLAALPNAGGSEAMAALIEALKGDPNPAVRIKAIEALAKATATAPADPDAVSMLREKAAQDDENVYVRVKAAEALSQMSL